MVSLSHVTYKPTQEEVEEARRLYALHKNTRGVYMGMVDHDKVRVGRSDVGIGGRVDTHRKDFEHFILFHVEETDNPYAVERYILNHPSVERVTGFCTRNGVETNEVVRLTNTISRSGLKVLAERALLENIRRVCGSEEHERMRWRHEERMTSMKLIEQAWQSAPPQSCDDIKRAVHLLGAMDRAKLEPLEKDEHAIPAAREVTQWKGVSSDVASRARVSQETVDPLLQFLKSRHVRYSSGAVTRMDEIKERFAEAFGVPVNRKVSWSTFTKADKRYVFSKVNICRSCRANDTHRGKCCLNYRRTSIAAIKGLSCLPYTPNTWNSVPQTI